MIPALTVGAGLPNDCLHTAALSSAAEHTRSSLGFEVVEQRRRSALHAEAC